MVQWIQNEKMNSKAAARTLPIQRLTLKNPRNPVNPDSKLPIQRPKLKNPRNPENPDSKLPIQRSKLKNPRNP